MTKVRVWSLDLERGWRGGENQVLLLQRGLRELNQDIDSTVLARDGERLATRLAAAGLAVTPCRNTRQAYGLLRAAAKRGEIDVIHAHTGRSHSLAVLAARGTGVPVVVTRRVDFAIKRSWRARWKYGTRVHRIVAISQAIADILVTGGVDSERISIIPSGVDPERMAVAPAPIRAELGIAEDAPIVLCAAALVAHKGHRYLLKAWSMVSAANPTAHLLLAGDGELADELKAQAQALDRVHFLGWRDDLPGLLRAATVYTMASVEEGLGTALIDAAFARVPIAATAAGGIPEIILDGETGLLAPVADSTTLATALNQLLYDRPFGAKLADAAFTHAEQYFHYRTMAESYVQLYSDLQAERA